MFKLCLRSEWGFPKDWSNWNPGKYKEGEFWVLLIGSYRCTIGLFWFWQVSTVKCQLLSPVLGAILVTLYALACFSVLWSNFIGYIGPYLRKNKKTGEVAQQTWHRSLDPRIDGGRNELTGKSCPDLKCTMAREHIVYTYIHYNNKLKKLMLLGFENFMLPQYLLL